MGISRIKNDVAAGCCRHQTVADGKEDKTAGGRDPKRDSLELARRYWSERRKEVVTRDAAEEIMRNLMGFFRVLVEWDGTSNEAE